MNNESVTVFTASKTTSGGNIYINLDHAVCIEAEESGCKLTFVGGYSVSLSDTAIDLINKTKQALRGT